ncbi:MAG: sulfotransferase [Vicinamibacterales bacterium]
MRRPRGGSRIALERAIRALRAGDPIEAEQALREHLLAEPNDAEALTKLAEIAIDQRRIDAAALLLRRAASADPSIGRHQRLICHILAHAGPAAALNEIEALPARTRTLLDMQLSEATLLGMLGQHHRQLALLERLLSEDPDNGALWIAIGGALNTIGRAADAVAAVRRSIAIDRSSSVAYWTLANFKSFRFTDHDIRVMQATLSRKHTSSDRLLCNFALGKAFEDRKDYARSFAHYAAGNRIRAANLTPRQTQVTRFVDLALATYTSALLDRPPRGETGATGPVFVLGLHRSGSTLIEQILASHAMIEGSGELPAMPQLWDRIVGSAARDGISPLEYVARCEPATWASIGAEYLQLTQPFRRTRRRLFVDKLPSNWLYLGLIRLALPNAKIIDTRRNPMACGFANFKQHYPTGVTFAYSLQSIGRFYRDYLRMMDHFDCVAPGAVHHLVYEHLVEDPEREVRRILKFIGVPFDPACLHSHRTERAVSTPSAEQVRCPIYRDGIEAWRPYRRWLGPLKEALGPAINSWLPAKI